MQPYDVGTALAVLAELAPPSVAAVATLISIDPCELTGAQQVNQLKALDRQASWIAACQAQVLAAMDIPVDRAAQSGGPVPAGRPELVAGPGSPGWTELEVAAALRLSPMAAARRLDFARELCSRLPGSRTALAGGRIGFLHALTITETTGPLTGALGRCGGGPGAAAGGRAVGRAAPPQSVPGGHLR